LSIAVILPTYNEAENLPKLVKRIREVSEAEIVVVDDDSPDNTAEVARGLACTTIVRKGKRKGLSASVIDALRAVKADKIIVMDADLQHPPELLPLIFGKLSTHSFVVTDRTHQNGHIGLTGWRRLVSQIANLLAYPLIPAVKDRTTGYFGFRHEVLPDNLDKLSPRGFKIMLELLVKGNVSSIDHVPMRFGKRQAGESKLGSRTVIDYLVQLAELYLYRFRWLRFGLVGAVGAAIHFPVLYILTDVIGLFYIASAVIAIVIASTNNYFLNNLWTFEEKARSGLKGHLIGWTQYQVLSSVGDGLYLGLLALFTEVAGTWYIASAALSIVVVFVFKFIWADKVIWRRRGSRIAQLAKTA